MRAVILTLALLFLAGPIGAEPPAGAFTTGEAGMATSRLGVHLHTWAIRLGAEEHSEAGIAQLDLNAWRSAAPDDFVPGPMNDVLGAFRLADARSVSLNVESGTQLVLRWERRDDRGEDGVFVVAQIEDDGHPDLERWTVKGLGLRRVVEVLSRLAITFAEPDEKASVWQRHDRYVRSRSSLLNSLDRACDEVSIVCDDPGSGAMVCRFDPAVSRLSLQRALDRLLVDSVEWEERDGALVRPLVAANASGSEIRPVVLLFERDGGVSAVLALDGAGAMSVYTSIASATGQ